jgi:hypothetical protein
MDTAAPAAGREDADHVTCCHCQQPIRRLDSGRWVHTRTGRIVCALPDARY